MRKAHQRSKSTGMIFARSKDRGLPSPLNTKPRTVPCWRVIAFNASR